MNKLLKDKDFWISISIGSILGLIASGITYNIWSVPSESKQRALRANLRLCQIKKHSSEEKYKKCMKSYNDYLNELDPFAFFSSALFVFPLTVSTVAWFNYFRRKKS